MIKDLIHAKILVMNTVVSISQIKTCPSKIINNSLDYPIAVQKRNKTLAYLVGKELYEKLISYIEDQIDSKIVKSTDFSKGEDFEKVAETLGV